MGCFAKDSRAGSGFAVELKRIFETAAADQQLTHSRLALGCFWLWRKLINSGRIKFFTACSPSWFCSAGLPSAGR